MTRDRITKKLILYQCLAYSLLIFLITGNEVFDFPHNIFGAPATPINWTEAAIEGMYILVLCVFSVWLTWGLLKRIKYLEGILSICSFCKKIRIGKEWRQLEEYISTHSAAEFSHGLCPECAKKHYGDFLRE
jgi:hypothetical protein